MFQNELYDIFQNHPTFSVDRMDTTLDLDAKRRLSYHQNNVIKFARQLAFASVVEDHKRASASTRTLIYASPSAYVKYSVGDAIFRTSIMSMGTARHQSYAEDCEDGKVKEHYKKMFGEIDNYVCGIKMYQGHQVTLDCHRSMSNQTYSNKIVH